MNQEDSCLRERTPVRNTYILPKRISAIRLETKAVSQMPAGSHLEVCGEGYNPRTVKVSCGGTLFFVFREDLN